MKRVAAKVQPRALCRRVIIQLDFVGQVGKARKTASVSMTDSTYKI